MAGIGLYGTYYSKCTMSGGVLQSYTGVQQMGKAISANFEPVSIDDNPLYANNAIAETAAMAAAGGTLTLTLDQLKQSAAGDLYGLTSTSSAVQIAISGTTTTVTGTGFDEDGTAMSNPVGVAFISCKQESQDRSIYDVVIYAHCTFKLPSEDFSTMTDTIDWQTPELEAAVSGASGVTGTYPWRKRRRFTNQDAAIQYITDCFAAPSP